MYLSGPCSTAEGGELLQPCQLSGFPLPGQQVSGRTELSAKKNYFVVHQRKLLYFAIEWYHSVKSRIQQIVQEARGFRLKIRGKYRCKGQLIFYYGKSVIQHRIANANALSKRTQRSCVLLRSLKKNVLFFALFYILHKRTQRSLRSFMFIIKECGVLCVLLRSL